MPAILGDIALVLLALLLGLRAATSLRWRMVQDTPLLYYAAYLMDEHGRVPYRDFLETSMPGTFAFYYLVGHCFGYDDPAVRWVDLALLATLLAAIVAFMSRFGRRAGPWAAVVFGLVYFAHGPSMSLQRDYLGMIPIAFALLCVPSAVHPAVSRRRFAAVGLLFGLSATLKPHLALGLPIVCATLLAQRRRNGRRDAADAGLCATVAGVAFLAPAAVAALWLARHDALVPFLRIMTEYIPLHSAMTAWHQTLPSGRRAFYLVEYTLNFGGFGPLLLCALFSYYLFRRQGNGQTGNTPAVCCLLVCSAAYSLYPTVAGKFWDYHYMPLAFFLALMAGLLLNSALEGSASRASASWVPLACVLVALCVHVRLPRYVAQVAAAARADYEPPPVKGGRVRRIAAWLSQHSEPGDQVQPLDWTGGAVHAMLRARVGLATGYLYDYHFYHHVSTEVVQSLRASFIEQLADSSPRFIIEVETDKPWVSGEDSTRTFRRLSRFLEAQYDEAVRGDGWVIYERRS